MYVNDQERFLRNSNSASMPRKSVYGIMAPLCPRVTNVTTGLIAVNNSVKLLNVFPNPSQNELVLSFLGQKIKKGIVFLYSVTGQKVYELSFTENDLYNNQLQLNVNALPQGVYNGSVDVDQHTLFFKFVKASD